uniref:AMP-dependent synthetase/ligase domain-containing protein n=1 Tax=Corethron hystrix TaxID=216773 RepID=A0A7S1G3A0_9STRA|mmetsp:Transcript_8393/g.18400  ORF Transcript_8393/g.18400 Transcript_8393/m.18400 type:complete len:722 (+) Transcript_8393:139-2304(+)
MPAILLLPIQVALTVLDFAIFLLTFGWIKLIPRLFAGSPLRSVAVDGNEAHRVRAGFSPATLELTPFPGVDTLHGLMERTFNTYSNLTCMKRRTFLGQHKGNPKVKHFGETTSLTYAETEKMSQKFGASLRQAGLVPCPPEASLEQKTTPSTIAIFENTCPEWLCAAIGSFSQAISVTTIYATLGIDAVVDAVQDGRIPALLCNKKSLPMIAKRLDSMKSLKTIIYTNDLVEPDDSTPIPTVKGVTFVSFEDFVANGDTKAHPPSPPKPSTEAVVMYTSGSTGKPKGVVLTHKNVLAMAAGMLKATPIQSDDVYLAYLPLAHIMELSAEFVTISLGVCLCYADPKSLSKTGAYPTGALEEYSPTIMAGVPKIWDVIKKGIETKIAGSSPVVKFLFKTAFAARSFAIKRGYDTPFFNALVFKKISAATGGKIRLGLSGGGPLNDEIQTFISTALKFPLGQGYGLTETCAGLTLQDQSDTRSGIAGVPVSCVEVLLKSCADVNDKAGLPYLETDRKDADGNDVLGRGEVLVRGNNISIGYYKMPDKTAEVFDKDGWFHTGDIGQWASDGSLRIVDRLKNLIKLKGGEYIAVEQMEMVYGNSPFVDAVAGGICCYGDGDMDRPIAIMQLSKQTAMAWAKDNGAEGDYEKIKALPEFYTAVHQSLLEQHKIGNLSNLEKVIAVSIIDEPWTSDNGCLTATNKLQRKSIIEVFKKEFELVKKKGIF